MQAGISATATPPRGRGGLAGCLEPDGPGRSGQDESDPGRGRPIPCVARARLASARGRRLEGGRAPDAGRGPSAHRHARHRALGLCERPAAALVAPDPAVPDPAGPDPAGPARLSREWQRKDLGSWRCRAARRQPPDSSRVAARREGAAPSTVSRFRCSKRPMADLSGFGRNAVG